MKPSSRVMDEILIDALEFFVEKLKSGNCPLSQVEAVYKAYAENMDVTATVEELSKYFGKSRAAVHGVIKRSLTSKPKRNITHYSFKNFVKVMPPSWRKKHDPII